MEEKYKEITRVRAMTIIGLVQCSSSVEDIMECLEQHRQEIIDFNKPKVKINFLLPNSFNLNTKEEANEVLFWMANNVQEVSKRIRDIIANKPKHISEQNLMEYATTILLHSSMRSGNGKFARWITDLLNKINVIMPEDIVTTGGTSRFKVIEIIDEQNCIIRNVNGETDSWRSGVKDLGICVKTNWLKYTEHDII